MREWIDLAKQGDHDAFRHIVHRFKDMAMAVACDRLNDPHLAEDAVQEAFAEAFVHLPKLADPEAFPGWFKRIVMRRCSRMLRRKTHPSVPLDSQAHIASLQLTPAEIVERRELREAVRSRITALPRNMRVAVMLFYIHGYSLAEISDYLETPVPALKKRLFDARRKLKGTLPVGDFITVFRHLYEGGKRMLHIVNGDSVAEKLKQGVVQGDILVWREIYSEGPVFADPAEPAHRAVRADYLEKEMGIPKKEFIDGCIAQEQKLRQFREYDEVVLWFEHDLFDQTMLCWLLNWFSRQSLGSTKLSLLCIGSFPGIELFRGLGQLSVEQMETLSGTWHPVQRAELELGRKVWEAYASPDPRGLLQLLQEDTSALPFVKDAFRFHLTRFPSAGNGIGSIEKLTLELLQDGIDQPIELFRRAGAEAHWFGMGDLQYWLILKQMSQGSHPLIRVESDAPFPGYTDPSPRFLHSRIEMTDTGRSVLNGEADWIGLNGIDRWLGGVHLREKDTVWRWDERKHTLIAG